MANTTLSCSFLTGIHSMLHSLLRDHPINNIDTKCHIKKLKSSRTFLIGYLGLYAKYEPNFLTSNHYYMHKFLLKN